MVRVGRVLLSYYSAFLLLLVWEGVAQAGLVRALFLPPVSTILAQGAALVADGTLVTDSGISIVRALVGLGLAAAVGIPAGIGMARLRAVHWFCDPFVTIGFPTPKISLIPIFILWFGIGHLSTILLVGFGTLFPIVVATYHGARGVERLWVWSARAMGAGERDVLWKVVIPATLPFIFTGMRVALPLSLILVFTSEMVAGGGGLGFILINAQRYFETPTVYAALYAVLLIGFVFDRLLLLARERILGWHEEATKAVTEAEV
ncbi:MAG: ABC transporter permease [Deltaproteobacteria bacterium]|nr:ABC transporter permease [Deltaproteobacteria bacterium]